MIPENELTAQALREEVQQVCQGHLPLAVSGYKCTTEMLYDVLFKAATDNSSIEAACNELAASASGNRVREILNEQLTVAQLASLEEAVNAALAAHIPPQLFSDRVEAAIDEHDEACYAKHADLRDYTCRRKAKAGTCHCLRIITLYVMKGSLRLTLAVAFVRSDDQTVPIVQRLLQRVAQLGLKIAVLYMDRGFCNGPVIGYLTRIKQPTVLACTIRGKHGGTRQLCRGRKNYRTRYTFTDGTTVNMAVVTKLVPDKTKQLQRKWFLYVLIGLDWAPSTVYRCYRRRFGIEVSYRLMRCVRIKSTSRNAALRFFLFGFALLLVNSWSRLRWWVARIQGPGPWRIDPDHFKLQSFISLLRRAVELLYQTPFSIPILASKPKTVRLCK